MKLLKKIYSIHSKSGKEQKMIKFLLWYIKHHMKDCKIELDKKVGNIYVTKGVSDTYPCLVAHIDQVQTQHSKDFQAIETQDIIFGWSPKNKRFEGLGADDGNGVWVALKTLQKTEALKVAFFVGEETGCVGSNKANMDFFNDCRFVIECDRRGNSDIITNICCTELCSTQFLEATGYKDFGYHEENGMMTDVLTLKEQGLSVSCCNMSCGYYQPHTDQEYTVKADLFNCLALVEHIIENCTDVYPHEYEYRGYGSIYDGGFYDYYYDEIYEVVTCHPELSFNDIWAVFKDYYPSINRLELEQTYDMVKDDLEYWRTRDYL